MLSSLVFTGMLTLLSGAPDIFHGAKWLRDPALEAATSKDVFHRQGEAPPEFPGPRNVHTLFRNTISLRQAPEHALLFITGDDFFKFYVNGDFVVEGPAPGYPSNYPFYYVDVVQFLEPGLNVLAAHAYYQGLINRTWCSGDNRAGFMLALEVTYPDGTAERFVTNEDWKTWSLDAFNGERILGTNSRFAEDIDMRRFPVAWRNLGFDDAAWKQPVTRVQDHQFTLQRTPPLKLKTIRPWKTDVIGDGVYLYDFGEHLVGYTRIRIRGEEDSELLVRHGDEILNGRVMYQTRAGTEFEEKVVLSGAEDLVEFYDFRTFRYLEIVGDASVPEVWIETPYYPVDSEASFVAEGHLLEKIWNLSRNALKMSAHGNFLNTPSQDRGQFIADSLIASRAHQWLTADPRLSASALESFALSMELTPGMMSLAPASMAFEIAEYPLQFPLMLKQFYMRTGEAELVTEVLENVLPRMLRHYAQYEEDSGLLGPVAGPVLLVDWPESMQDEYDLETARQRPCALLNAFYYGALQTTAELMHTFDRDAAPYESKAQQIAQAFQHAFLDEDTGLFLDAEGSEHSALHANAIPLFFGLVQPEHQPAVVEFIREKGLACSPYIAAYLIEALFLRGEPQLAYDLLTSDGTNSWHNMIQIKASACTQTWAIEQSERFTWCHVWGVSPMFFIVEHIFGLRPESPGATLLTADPPALKDLPEMRLDLPFDQGMLHAAYHPDTGFEFIPPPGIEVRAASENPDLIKIVQANAPQAAGEPESEPSAPDSAAQTEKQAPDADPGAGEPAMNPDALLEQDLLETVVIKPPAPADAPVFPTVDTSRVPELDLDALAQLPGWHDHAAKGPVFLVVVDTQSAYLIENGAVVWSKVCATATNGVGSEAGSNKTPLGWHKVSERFGDGAPEGEIFRSRARTNKIWRPGDDVKEDLVLTRVLWLEGLEEGLNKGQKGDVLVDSKLRYIYIHGTNGEHVLGTPSSHGCIRLSNKDVIDLYDRMPIGTPVLIVGPPPGSTQTPPAAS